MSATNLLLLVVHCLATYALATLYSPTLDRWQKGSLYLLMIGQYLMVLGYSFAMAGDRLAMEQATNIRWIGQEFEHVGVLVYVFRLYFKEKVLCLSGSHSSRS